MDLYELQIALLRRKLVSVPELQLWLGFTYLEAKELVERLQRRGWLSRELIGRHYAVQREYCKLRRLRRDEVDKLIRTLDSDCCSALECVQKNDGATYDELLAAVRGDDDTDDALEKLTDCELMYQYDGTWFLCVSHRASTVIRMMLRRRRSLEPSQRHTLRTMFEPLFED